jgi:uncharacterized protein YjbI with pentapeptide repeats
LTVNKPESSDDALTRVRAIFAGHEPDLGRADAPTKAGFIELARQGRDVWNAWRTEWPRPVGNFDKADFGKLGITNLRGFRFNAPQPSSKSASISFEGASFESAFDFTGATFGSLARFDGATFRGQVRFGGAEFGPNLRFSGAIFQGAAHFEGARFDRGAWFWEAQFHQRAIFDGAQFDQGASFMGARFEGDVTFEAWDEGRLAAFWLGFLDEEAVEARLALVKRLGLRSDAFLDITFSGARFARRVSFQNRGFLGMTDFGPVKLHDGHALQGTPTRFEGVPEFHGCRLHQNTSFDDAKFDAPSSLEAARAYRSLKLAMAQQQAVREEQRFFRLEMKVEADLEMGPRRALFRLYRWLSDYGFSLWRPVRFWLWCFVIFGLAHASLAFIVACERPSATRIFLYSLLNAMPLGFDSLQGALRLGLFKSCGGGIADSVALIVISLDVLHKTGSFLALFLAGLALRNMFKMKG